MVRPALDAAHSPDLGARIRYGQLPSGPLHFVSAAPLDFALQSTFRCARLSIVPTLAISMPNSEEPSRTHEHALSQLRYIRSTMDGATRFTAVPGAGTAVIGVTAFVAAGLGQMQSTRDAMLSVWVGEAV